MQPFDPKNLPETKYGGETVDPNAHLIPYLIAPKTLAGEHISDYKLRQIEEQHSNDADIEVDKLKPAEEP